MASTQIRNTQVKSQTLTDTQESTANIDGVAATPSLRTLGSGSQQACGGADARLPPSNPANGTLLIGNGTTFSNALPSGTTHQIIVTAGAGTLTLSLPQSIDTTSAVQFGSLEVGIAGFAGEYANGNSGASFTIDWSKGNYQSLVLTGACTLTFINGNNGHCQLRLIQDATGGRTIAVTGYYTTGGIPPRLTPVANAVDFLGVYFDGTHYHCGSSLSNSLVN